MATSIRAAIPKATVELREGGRGDFIVKAGEVVLWDKRRGNGEFPPHQVIVAKLR